MTYTKEDDDRALNELATDAGIAGGEPASEAVNEHIPHGTSGYGHGRGYGYGYWSGDGYGDGDGNGDGSGYGKEQ